VDRRARPSRLLRGPQQSSNHQGRRGGGDRIYKGRGEVAVQVCNVVTRDRWCAVVAAGNESPLPRPAARCDGCAAAAAVARGGDAHAGCLASMMETGLYARRFAVGALPPSSPHAALASFSFRDCE